ncbi:hypothetical protein [uncultured Deefgea sp.]|uniref:hypothetical protein n=1 Tax=uncultured Deefgea sp. TaxID=1304914 RepID=UPI0026183447|nr:hypothetical protein [uncultured Deefgea sp.]
MDDYKSAAVRHFSDAKYLFDSGKTDNAGHLIGFAAECAIKYKITTLRPGQNAPHGHFPDIVGAAKRHLAGRNPAAFGMLQHLNAGGLDGWNVNRRYNQTGVTTSEELASWFQFAQRLLATTGIKERG